jgi:hypothetical protein
MPLSLLFIPLFIFLIVFLLYAFSAFYHIFRFELWSVVSLTMSALFVVGTLLIGMIGYSYGSTINWDERVSFSSLTDFIDLETGENNVLSF